MILINSLAEVLNDSFEWKTTLSSVGRGLWWGLAVCLLVHVVFVVLFCYFSLLVFCLGLFECASLLVMVSTSLC